MEGSDIESDEDEDMEDDDTGPPQGCDHQIYESVIDLRDKRLEMEDALQEIQKAVEAGSPLHNSNVDVIKAIRLIVIVTMMITIIAITTRINKT